VSVVPGRDVHIDDAHRWITKHITRRRSALDGESADGIHRPKELTHAPYPWLLVIPAGLAVRASPRSTGRKRLTPTHRAGTAHRAHPTP
jgi:hypothetical protein